MSDIETKTKDNNYKGRDGSAVEGKKGRDGEGGWVWGIGKERGVCYRPGLAVQ